MEINYEISVAEKIVSIAIFSGFVSFLLYWIAIHSKKIKQWVSQNEGSDSLKMNWFLFSKWVGFVLFVSIPLFSFILGNQEMGLTLLLDSFYWKNQPFHFGMLLFVVALPTVLVLSYFSGKNVKLQEKYPEVKLEKWNVTQGIKFVMGWSFYLLGYEILFRGVLFLIPAIFLGFPIALMLNLALYSISHIPKGMDEALVAVPVGVLLCILTYKTESIWLAFFLHLAMSISGNYFAWKHKANFLNRIKP